MMTKSTDLTPLIQERLELRLRKVLYSAGRAADALGWKIYCVGGSVRDLLLKKNTFDLDILVEEHGLEFARHFAREEKGTLKLYRRFATAMVIMPGGIKVDITTTRGEFYPEPGSLPEVIPGSFEEDIRRRDFTINAMAFSLNRGEFGQLRDITGGFDDLDAGVIRVLHADSFRDDPTRIFRAVRFQQRLGFSIEPRTEELMRTAVDLRLFEKVSPERLRHELELIFKEPDPPGAIESMARYDELRFIHPRLSYSNELKSQLYRIRENYAWFRERFGEESISRFRLYFGALLFSLPEAAIAETGEKFNLSIKFSGQLKAVKRSAEEIIRTLSSTEEVAPSRVYYLLRGIDREILLIIMSGSDSEHLVSRIRRYLTEYRFVSGEVNGGDLKKLGIPTGPEYKEILNRLLSARLDGEVRSREEELNLARRLVDTGD
jgi:tRNA nucleotidyltransferase (CCA-adding enzyme)